MVCRIDELEHRGRGRAASEVSHEVNPDVRKVHQLHQARAEGYGMAGFTVDGTDVLAVYEEARKAAERARGGDGPTLIEAKTYRLTAHSSDDNDRTYRSREEVEMWRAKEPMPKYRQYLLDSGVATEQELEDIKKRIDAEVNDATDCAEVQPEPDAADVLKHVYASPEERAKWQ